MVQISGSYSNRTPGVHEAALQLPDVLYNMGSFCIMQSDPLSCKKSSGTQLCISTAINCFSKCLASSSWLLYSCKCIARMQQPRRWMLQPVVPELCMGTEHLAIAGTVTRHIEKGMGDLFL